MKKLLFIILSTLVLTGCYDDYVKDYTNTGIYIAYQYDLRTFVIGEGMKFDFSTQLGGVMNNTQNRKVKVTIDDTLVTDDLAQFAADPTSVSAFTALDGMLGNAPVGQLSNSYVTTDVKAQSLTALTPLPAAYYTRPDVENMVIGAGKHSAAVTIKADSAAIVADANALKPYYAIGFKIESADADTVLKERSYSIIAVRCENKFYGNYYHGGVTKIVDNLTGDVVDTETYRTTIPETTNARIYKLTTAAPNALTTNRVANKNGSLLLTFDGDDITVAFADGSKVVEPTGEGSSFNGARLLQNRKLLLNYKFDNGDNTTTIVQDTLTFRNRTRDGINEWQDENLENYK